MVLPSLPPSIFNDVIGPVMRGPSSSHCAAAQRIGKVARDIMAREFSEINIWFNPNSSLAHTHKTQGSDMGLFSGLMGWELVDERVSVAENEFKKKGIDVSVGEKTLSDTHPNSYFLEMSNPNKNHSFLAVSTGGGMIEIKEIDGVTLEIRGDYYETLVLVKNDKCEFDKLLNCSLDADHVKIYVGNEINIIQIQTQQRPKKDLFTRVRELCNPEEILHIEPVLPVLSKKGMTVPFTNAEELLAFNKNKNLAFWELAMEYESQRGSLTKEEVFDSMKSIVHILENSLQEGLKGTDYPDRVIGFQSGNYIEQLNAGTLVDMGAAKRIIPYITALMEVKSSMGVIVACPTAGSCGAVPGSVLALSEEPGLNTEGKVKAMLAAGLVGVLIAHKTTFAAEVCGCQAECGSASGMAAAAIATLVSAPIHTVLSAVSMALQNSLGWICDPVANRVEVPCLGKNILAATNALSCVNMALAGYDEVIPLDQVIETMDPVGRSIDHKLRCTALGGLSVTKRSKEIEMGHGARGTGAQDKET